MSGEIVKLTYRTMPTQDYVLELDDSGIQRSLPRTVCWVLVAGKVGDYAAYVGIGIPDWVAECGDKLTFDEAEKIWDDLDEGKYRQ